jgi:hypothetical protein
MTWKAYLLVSSGAGVLATVLVSPPASPTERPTPARKAGASRNKATSDIQQLAVQLQSRVQVEKAYRQPARNPFRFSARNSAPPRAVSATPAAVTQPPPAAPAPPPLAEFSLLGMTADLVDGVTQRTAILKTAQGVVLVKVGDAAGSGYTVDSVSEGAVELKSADGTTRRISFKP